MPDMIATFAESPMLGADILVSPQEDIDITFKEARGVHYTDLYPDYQYHGDRNNGYSYSINGGATASLEFRENEDVPGLGWRVTRRLVDTAPQKIRLGKNTVNTLRIFKDTVNYVADVYSSGHYQETYEKFKVFLHRQGTVMPADSITLDGIGIVSGNNISVTLTASMSSPIVVPFVASAAPLADTTVKSDPLKKRFPVEVGVLKLKGSDYYGDPDGPIEGYIYGFSENISGTCYYAWSCYYSDCGGFPITFQKNKYLGAYYFQGTYIKNGEQKFYCHFNNNDVGKTFTFDLLGYVIEPHIRGPLPNPYSALYEHAVIMLSKPVHLRTVTVVAE